MADDGFDAARAPRIAAPCAAAGPRQRPHARGDEPLSRHRRRSPARRLAGAAHLAARSAIRRRRISSTTARVSPPPKCCAAESRAATTCTSFPRRARGHSWSSGCVRCWAAPILDFPTPYAADADGYLARGLAIRDALKHEPHARVLAGPARALHGERRHLGQDRRVRASARSAGPDASRRDRAGSEREPHRAWATRRSLRLHELGVDRPAVHRDSRACILRRTTSRSSRRTVATSCIARCRT